MNDIYLVRVVVYANMRLCSVINVFFSPFLTSFNAHVE